MFNRFQKKWQGFAKDPSRRNAQKLFQNFLEKFFENQAINLFRKSLSFGKPKKGDNWRKCYNRVRSMKPEASTIGNFLGEAVAYSCPLNNQGIALNRWSTLKSFCCSAYSLFLLSLPILNHPSLQMMSQKSLLWGYSNHVLLLKFNGFNPWSKILLSFLRTLGKAVALA